MTVNGGSISSTSSPSLSNAAAVTLCTVPAGVGTLILSNNSGATVYYAFGGTIATTTDGVAIATGGPPLAIPMYPGSRGTTVSVIAATAPTASAPVSWLFSSGQ